MQNMQRMGRSIPYGGLKLVPGVGRNASLARCMFLGLFSPLILGRQNGSPYRVFVVSHRVLCWRQNEVEAV